MDKNKKDKFSFVWGFCLIILLVVCISGFGISLRGTHAYFGGGTTGSFTVYGVNYETNYPDDVMLENKSHMDKQRTNFNMLLDNMFDVPDGYKFNGWKDSVGNKLMPGDVKFLEEDVSLYAEWIKDDNNEGNSGNEDEEGNGDGDLEGDLSGETTGIAYGDVNLNGLIDEEDYKLVLEYIDGSINLDDVVLINADVNDDKKVDLVDADIIKNAFLGTNGYVGFLPEKPILIYDIYEGNIDSGNGGNGNTDVDSDDDNTSNDSSNSDCGSYSGGGSGNGSGTGSGGTGGNGNSSGGSSNGNTNSSGNNSGSSNNSSSNGESHNNVEDNNVEEEKEEEIVLEKKVFKFKYMNGLAKFGNTSCETTSGSCLIVLPDKTPVREGYTFKGWSKNKDCKGKDLIVTSVSVDSGGTYYACYLKNIDEEETGNNYYIWIIVFLISALSFRLIWHVIYKFRCNEDSNDEIK